jgi:hypothetical protein
MFVKNMDNKLLEQRKNIKVFGGKEKNYRGNYI